MTTVAFLIENERLGKRAMFDLGTRKDYWNSPPFTLTRIEAAIPGVKIDKDVTEILEENGIKLSEIGMSHLAVCFRGDISCLLLQILRLLLSTSSQY